MAGQTERHYPIFVDLTGRLVVIVGGGEAAERRVRQLRRYGADVTVISPDPGSALLAAEAEGELTIERRAYQRGNLAEAFLAVCVAEDPEVRRAVHGEAESSGRLLNVADEPGMCSFIVPAVVNRGPLQIAVSTGGLAPGLTKQLRREIAEKYGAVWGEYARLLGEVRAIVFEQVDDEEKRVAVLTTVAESDLFERLEAGESPTAAEVVGPYLPQAETADNAQTAEVPGADAAPPPTEQGDAAAESEGA